MTFDPASLAPGTSSDLYHLTLEGLPADRFRVESFAGHEAISEPYRFDVVATVETSADADEDMERLALGRAASLVWSTERGERAFYGIIAAVRLAGVHEAGTRRLQYHLRLVPRLWLLKRRRRTRIFQHLRVPEILSSVLREAGIGTRFRLLRDHPPREYCTQYEESDLRFVQRLCAEAGVYFAFTAGGPLELEGALGPNALIPGDTVLFGDDASFYPPIGGGEAAEAPTLHFLAMQETKTSPVDKVTRFAARTVVKATSATYHDYDPERPMARLGGSTAVSPAPQALDAAVSLLSPGAAQTDLARDLEVYDHHGPFLFPKWAWASEEASLMLRQKRRRALTAQGESGCPDLSPAHRFTLADHPAAHLDRAWAVTRVEHRGRAHADEHHKVYVNTFDAVPAEVCFIPPRPKRRPVQVALTATVVGPAGEEIHVDGMGQIKVQFHWDRQGAYDEHSSCWIRTMHAFAGAGWGHPASTDP